MQTGPRPFKGDEIVNAMVIRSIAIVLSVLLVVVGGLLMLPGIAHGAVTAAGVVLLVSGFSIIGFMSLNLRSH